MTIYGMKRIADPVHGTIGLSGLEIEFISTGAFQRLRNIKQLGLSHLVFPGSDYSRLSHSIGVCHVTGRILEALQPCNEGTVTEEEHQQYRLAGLLHDVGHYPFSHAFESAVTDHYDNKTRSGFFGVPNNPANNANQLTDPEYRALDHEVVGQLLLQRDPELCSVLAKHGISSDEIFSIFSREQPPRFSNLISSDLDADRIDYLMRTALHTGLPYGTVDVDYLLTQMSLDAKNRICLTPKALRTAEHFLLGRFFDYRQVSYHTTVAAFEQILKEVIDELLVRGHLDCSQSGIENMIETGSWHRFDDPELLRLIRRLGDSVDDDDVLTRKIDSLLKRIPPKLIGAIEFIDDRHNSDIHDQNVRKLRRLSQILADKFNIDPRLWFVWESNSGTFTKVGPHAPVSVSPPDDDDLEQSIRVLYGEVSKPIFTVANSLMKILAQTALYASRLYVVFPEGREAERDDVTKAARCYVDDVNWVDG